MGRRLRYIPEGGSLVEITTRTVHGRYLLRPGRAFNEIFVGVLARAKRLYPLELVAVVCLSGHYHLLAQVEDAECLAQFMRYFNGNLAQEAGRLHDWREKIWGRRYQGIVVSDEEAAQVARLRYVLGNGVKENLVARPQDWPGVHCAEALLSGEPLRGFWFDRTKESSARRRGEKLHRYSFATEEVLTLDKLPCWRHVSDAEYRRRIADLLTDIEQEAAAMRRQRNIHLPSAARCAKAIERQHPHDRPAKPSKSAAPPFHAATKAARRELREAYAWFVVAFREAAKKLRDGDRNAAFPEGSFPPGLPFVRPATARGP